PRLPLLYAGDRDLQQAIYDAVNEGLVSIVDGNGTDVAVTAPGQVNLTSAGLRLAKPAPQTCPDCGRPTHTGPCPTAVVDGATSTETGSETIGGAQGPGATGPDDGPTGDPDNKTPAVKEKQVAFSFTSNLLASPDNADTFAALFKTLYMALDERQISYLLGTLQLVVDASVASELP